ncbi:hypothetical protein L3Y34_000838 [Caenorhabditis briggsae]|uniref:Uncharacterized protein n=1 Tax=Caenorhabditis briggsae TaxID=6238 RepID=A0AAE9IPH5_CAEBR|nr:hypothetical protein L3Y34_000838 [Caenorhabditis briggsae]
MDNQRKKRNSILKVRQETNLMDVLEDTTVATSSGATNRRVSFHQLKQVKNYDRAGGQIIDATPIKEKAYDTMSSDGNSTSHTTRLDMDITGLNSTPVTPKTQTPFNGSMDMSVENYDETARLFDITRDKTICVYEKTVETTTTKVVERVVRVPEDRAEVDMSVDGGSEGALKVDDTISVFNQTNVEPVDMDITVQKPLDDTMGVFRSPAIPTSSRIQKTSASTMDSQNMSMSMDMDITSNEMMAAFKSPKIMSSVLVAAVKDSDDMDLTGLVNTAAEDVADDTMAVFRTPTRAQTTIQKTSGEIPESVDMEMTGIGNSDAPDDTMAVFRTPTRAQQTVQKTSGEIPESVDMEMTLQNETLALLQPVSDVKDNFDDVAMDITQQTLVGVSDDTMAVFKNPAAEKKTPGKPLFDESMEIESTIVCPDNVTFSETAQPENPAYHSSMLMSMASEVSEDVVVQKTSESLQQSSMRMSTTITEDVTASKNPESSTISEVQKIPEVVQKTSNGVEDIQNASETPEDVSMEITSEVVEGERGTMYQMSTMDVDSLQKTSLASPKIQMTSFTDTSEKMGGVSETSLIQTMMIEASESMECSEAPEDVTASPEGLTMAPEDVTVASNVSGIVSVSSISRRRRSQLQESLHRESPRRMALEKNLSMMSQMGGASEALAEFRQNKLKNQTTLLNDSVNTTIGANTSESIGRDIFKMNTSIRSPAHRSSTAPSPMVSKTLPESPKFHVTPFDAAIVNVIYLTPEDAETQEPIPEAFEFEKVLSAEESNVHKEIDTANWSISGAIKSNLDAEVMNIARGQAEMKFLELRGKFAKESNVEIAQKIQELESQNLELAGKIRDSQNLRVLQKQIEELQKPQFSLEEAERIENEYHETKVELLRAQAASIRRQHELLMTIREERRRLIHEIEEKDELLARCDESIGKFVKISLRLRLKVVYSLQKIEKSCQIIRFLFILKFKISLL